MLRLYTDTSFLTETYRRQVFPLLFDLVFKPNTVLLSNYEIVDTVEVSDIVVFPINYTSFLKHKNAFSALNSLAKTHNKPVWIYTAGDYGFTNYIANSYTFRLGGFNSKLDDNTFVIPSFINDPYDDYLPEGFSVLLKKEKPTIGFVGHAQSGILKYLKEYSNHLKYQLKRTFKRFLVDSQTFYPSSIKRANYLSVLANNNQLNTQFILRNQYRAGATTDESVKESTKAFYNNIYNNAYTFCIRGVGNFSVRFYETLAVGRIPILLDTDCRLPLNNSIDWSEHCLILNERSQQSIGEQVIEFHNTFSNEAFEALQQSNRELWLESLKREAYFTAIHNQFKTEIL